VESAAVSVTVAPVERRDVPILETAVGNVQALQNVTLRSQIDGVLTRVSVREGQRVDHGELLAVLDDRVQSAALNQARAAEERDEANLKIAQLDLRRDENLLAGEAISRQSVEEQRALVDQLKATVQLDAAAIVGAQIQLSYTRIYSPVSGRVGMRRVDPGNVVHASDAQGLFSVAQIDPISVVFSVPQQDLPRLQPLLGDPSRAPVTAFDRDSGVELGAGQLMTFDNQIDAATGTLQMRALFRNPQGALWSGQFVTVQMRTSVDPQALVVDARAVQEGTHGSFVFEVRQGRAVVVPITLRYQQGNLAAVAGPLRPGDLIVTDGQMQLTADAAVNTVSDEVVHQPASAVTGAEVLQ
jgi:RND family efflux transporter MFP subunit